MPSARERARERGRAGPQLHPRRGASTRARDTHSRLGFAPGKCPPNAANGRGGRRRTRRRRASARARSSASARARRGRSQYYARAISSAAPRRHGAHERSPHVHHVLVEGQQHTESGSTCSQHGGGRAAGAGSRARGSRGIRHAQRRFGPPRMVARALRDPWHSPPFARASKASPFGRPQAAPSLATSTGGLLRGVARPRRPRAVCRPVAVRRSRR